MILEQKPLKILLIKTSSLGDILHTFPLLADLQSYANQLNKKIQIDWMMEQCFIDIASLHEFVGADKSVYLIPVNLRQWKKKWWLQKNRLERHVLWSKLAERQNKQPYDLIIDAQGLLKSVYLAKKTLKYAPYNHQTQFHGYDRKSIREPLANFFYHHKHAVSKSLHAVERIRLLGFASLSQYAKLQFNIQLTFPRLSIPLKQLKSPPLLADTKYALFFHGTSQTKKYWPIHEWSALAEYFIRQGEKVVLPWANDEELKNATNIQNSLKIELRKHVIILEKMPLHNLFYYIYGASQVISVDTGLGHLSTLICPTILIFGVTNPEKVGVYHYNEGDNHKNNKKFLSFNLGNQNGFPTYFDVIEKLNIKN